MSIEITPAALTKIRALLTKETPGSFLRLEIVGGGCSGFQYVFRIDNTRQQDDVFWGDNQEFGIDQQSLTLMKDALIDFVEDLMGASFVVKNPMASASCGCGSSFTITP